jgi:hypothetical protein
MGINLSGQVPGEQLNALLEHEDVLLGSRTPDPLIAVVVIERASLKYDDVKQQTSATVRFKWIEIIDEAAAASVLQFRDDAYARRTNQESAPTTLDGIDISEEAIVSDEAGGKVTEGPWAPDPDFDGPAAS